MKLTDIQENTGSKFISRVMNNYFESKVDVTSMTEDKARTMLTKVRGLMKEAKNSPKFHSSEKSPAYLQLLMMEQALVARLREYGADSARYQGGTAYSTSQTPAILSNIKDQDEEDEDEMEEGSCGSKRKMKESKLTESEVEQAQVVLAAQDMVDKIAGWMEDVADMQYKDLPSLVEMMRNEVGVNEAQSFLDAQTATLTTLLTALEQAKTDSTNAMAPLTGEQSIDPSEFGGEDELDLDAGVDNDTPPSEMDDEEEIIEPETDLGRERR